MFALASIAKHYTKRPRLGMERVMSRDSSWHFALDFSAKRGDTSQSSKVGKADWDQGREGAARLFESDRALYDYS
jgi:hypothetical protein